MKPWAPVGLSRETYRGDLHVLVEAPDGTMASATIMWLDEANKTAEFEPVGTHRVPGVAAGRAAHQTQHRGPRSGRS